jgi:cell shape-determining protein MreD
MNKLGVLLLVWVALGLELSLKPGLALGATPIAPSFVFVVLTLIALFAPPKQARWAALLTGLAMDAACVLVLRQNSSAGLDVDLRTLGPHALAMVLGVQLIIAIRHTTMRRNPLTMGFLAMLGYAAAQIVLITVLSVRASAFDPLAWSLGHELWTRLASSVYTGLAAWAIAFVLLPLAPLLGLQVASSYSSSGRMARLG